MNLNKSDKVVLQAALETEEARIKRAINAQSNQGIKELMQAELVLVRELQGRVSQEVAK